MCDHAVGGVHLHVKVHLHGACACALRGTETDRQKDRDRVADMFYMASMRDSLRLTMLVALTLLLHPLPSHLENQTSRGHRPYSRHWGHDFSCLQQEDKNKTKHKNNEGGGEKDVKGSGRGEGRGGGVGRTPPIVVYTEETMEVEEKNHL